MSELLREALNSDPASFNEVQRQTGILRQTLVNFARGKATLRLPTADRLAAYYGIVSYRTETR